MPMPLLGFSTGSKGMKYGKSCYYMKFAQEVLIIDRNVQWLAYIDTLVHTMIYSQETWMYRTGKT